MLDKMPTTEIRDVLDALLDVALTIPTHELEYADRMERRKERRQLEGFVPLPKPQRRRPSDGQPSGAPFDYEEYETRLTDRRAADPETFQREKAAKRKANRDWWDKYKEKGDFDNCNTALLEGRSASYNRLRDIWSMIVQIEQSQRLDRIHLDQAARIANIKNRERCRRPRQRYPRRSSKGWLLTALT